MPTARNTLEEMLLDAHCCEPETLSCVGCLVIRKGLTILACQRCGTERRITTTTDTIFNTSDKVKPPHAKKMVEQLLKSL